MFRSGKSIKLGFISRRKGNSPMGLCYTKRYSGTRKKRRDEEECEREREEQRRYNE